MRSSFTLEVNPCLVLVNEQSFMPKAPCRDIDHDDGDADEKFQSSQAETRLPKALGKVESVGPGAIKSSFTLEVDPCLVLVNELSLIPRAPRNDDENALWALKSLEVDPCLVLANELSFVPRAPLMKQCVVVAVVVPNVVVVVIVVVVVVFAFPLSFFSFPIFFFHVVFN